jgi:hypothetical protein
MADPLFLSLWLRDFSPLALPLYFRKTIDAFPHSRLRPGAILRVHAIDWREAPLLEEIYSEDFDSKEAAKRAQEFLHPDSGFQLEAFWDLWRWDGDWSLQPARVSIEATGPEFESDLGEHIRLDFGDESLFLPCERSDQLRPVQSNIRSLLHLAKDLETELPVGKRLLWSETDQNFVKRLQELLD